MSAIARHIQIARDNGAKEAFTFYMGQNVPTARANQAEIRSAGNKKAQFKAYCEIFGDQFDAPTRNAPARSESVEDTRQSVAERVLALLGINVDDIPAASIEVEAPTRTTRKASTTRKPRTSAKAEPKAVEALLDKEDTFLYHGTNSVSEWTVQSVHKTHVKATNANGRTSSWKHTTVAKLVESGKIDLI